MSRVKILRPVMAVLMVAACSGDPGTAINPRSFDMSGDWAGPCQVADTSKALNLGDLYFFDRLEITQTQISVGALVFSDSDCITPFVASYTREVPFEEGEYIIGNSVTTATGLAAHTLNIQDLDSNQIFENIVALIDGTLYFGFNPTDEAPDTLELPLHALDLDGGYRLR